MSVVRYRKRPVEVDTIQWTGSNEAEVQAFTGGASRFYALDDEDRENSDDPEATATVFDKLHSTWVLVYTGQHIVRGVKGEYYPIAEDVLAETYELADADGADLLPKANVVAWLTKKAREGTPVEQLASKVARGAVRPDNLRMLPATFFEPGRTYTDGTGYSAPEITTVFRVEHVTRHPERGHLRAIGWSRTGEPGASWHGDFRDEGEFDGWTEITEAGDDRG